MSNTYERQQQLQAPWTFLPFCRALLYGLEIKEDFKVLNSYAFESKDYQITPGSSWNYALKLTDDTSPESDLQFVSTGMEIGVPPFSLKGAPTGIMAKVHIMLLQSCAWHPIIIMCAGSRIGVVADFSQCCSSPSHLSSDLFQPPPAYHTTALWCH